MNDFFKNNSELLVIFLITLGALLLFPSTKLPTFEQVDIALKVPKFLNAGSPLVLNLPVKVKKIILNRKAMTQVTGLKTYWGITPLYRMQAAEVYGELLTSKKRSLFTHPNIQFFTRFITLKRIPLKTGNYLRIPTSTWKKWTKNMNSKKRHSP